MRRLLRCLVLVACLPRSLLPPPRCVSAFEQYKYFSLHRERGAEHFRVASSEYFDDDTVRRLLAILPLPTFHSILSQRHEAIGILRQSKSFPTRRCRMIKSDDILAAELVGAVEVTHGSGLRAVLMAIVDNLLSTAETLETITPGEVEDAAQELFLLLYGVLGKDANHAFGEVVAFACRHRREPTSWHRRMLRRESDQWRPAAPSSSSYPAAHPTRPESFGSQLRSPSAASPPAGQNRLPIFPSRSESTLGESSTRRELPLSLSRCSSASTFTCPETPTATTKRLRVMCSGASTTLAAGEPGTPPLRREGGDFFQPFHAGPT